MILLNGKSLGERQKQFNLKVNETYAKSVTFDTIKDEKGETEIDELFKITLASKYENIDYILKALKSGNSLLTTSAMNCAWIYDVRFIKIINFNYLHNEIFPCMSLKMKRKFLKITAKYVNEKNRIMDFYKYCVAKKLYHNAIRFLINIEENLKMDSLTEYPTIISMMNEKYLKKFIGDSFALSDKYLQNIEQTKIHEELRKLRFLYFISEKKFFELIEKYGVTDFDFSLANKQKTFDLKTSDSIMKSFKTKLVDYPIYLNFVNKNTLAKYSTIAEAKLYLKNLLPSSPDMFWKYDFCAAQKHLYDLIPLNEKFSFIKKNFTEKYPGKEFDLSSNFFKLKYYNMLTEEDRENWASKHLERRSKGEVLDVYDNDYMWYKFLKFDNALSGVKQYLTNVLSCDEKAKALSVLTETAQTQRDVELLLIYYSENHMENATTYKEQFLHEIISRHNVIEFDSKFWSTFSILFEHLTRNFIDPNDCSEYTNQISIVALIIHILHEMTLSDYLKKFLEYQYSSQMRTYLLKHKQNQDTVETILQYLIRHFTFKTMDEEKKINGPIDDRNLNNEIRIYVNIILRLLEEYNKPEEVCSEIAVKYIKLHWDYFKTNKFYYEKPIPFREDDLLRLLKKDANLTVAKLSLIEDNIYSQNPVSLNRFLKKLGIYFANDIAKDFLKFYKDKLSNESRDVKNIAVSGIFNLTDDDLKVELIMKHEPEYYDISFYNGMDYYKFDIQMAILKNIRQVRNPDVMSKVMGYLKGYYIVYLAPSYTSYLANFPLNIFVDMIEAILEEEWLLINGIQLAVQCFEFGKLKETALRIWEKNKENTYMREKLYMAILDKIIEDDSAIELYEVIKVFTLDLRSDDDDYLFIVLPSGYIPDIFFGDYLQHGWQVVNSFDNECVNIQRRTKLIDSIVSGIKEIDRAFLRSIVDEYLKYIFDKNEKELNCDSVENKALINAKWNLTANYIVYANSDEEIKENLQLIKELVHKFIETWDKPHSSSLTRQELCSQFISHLETKSYLY